MEWLLRAAAMLLLVAALVTLAPAGPGLHPEPGNSAGLRAALARWSTVAVPSEIQLTLDRAPDGVERDWLAALAATGTIVRWTGQALVATAMAVVPVADPAGGVDVLVSAPASTLIRLRDTLGIRDSAESGAAGARFHLADAGSAVEAVVGPVTARESLRDSLQLRRLLVLGRAGWETKFTIAALEERGWTVDARLAVARGADIVRTGGAAIDTARYSAVLALDSTAGRVSGQLISYVRNGGGLLLWPQAAATPAFAALAPGKSGELISDRDRSPAVGVPREALDLLPIARLSADAIVLERRGEQVAVAARREGAGRVVEVGYLDLWRWRMAGGDDAVSVHRDWLARLVAGVAYTGSHALAPLPADAAPVATLIDRLGAPSQAAITTTTGLFERWSGWIFAVICLALLGELVSRRARGVR